MFSESSNTLDSGEYILKNDTLFLTSAFKPKKENSVANYYIYQTFYFKKKEKICTPFKTHSRKQKLIFRMRIRAISWEKIKK